MAWAILLYSFGILFEGGNHAPISCTPKEYKTKYDALQKSKSVPGWQFGNF